MKQKEINLTLPDLQVGLQETILCIRHGRMDEASGVHGSIRRGLYRRANSVLLKRELDFVLKIDRGEVIFNIHIQRFYHHDGNIGRVFYLQGPHDSIFKDHVIKPHDQALLEIASWACIAHFSTPPKRAFARYFQVSENQNAENPIKDEVNIEFALPDENGIKNIEIQINKRLEEIEECLSLPEESLPECSPEDRFALKTDPYSKCRTQCRVRDFCRQYATVRANADQEYVAASAMLAEIK